MRIHHLCAHLGGGVGRFFDNIVSADCTNEHKFFLLDEPENTGFLSQSNLDWQLLAQDASNGTTLINNADLVEIDYWNHPALLKYLAFNKLTSTRLLVYSLVSGTTAPNILPKSICDYGEILLLPGPSSLCSNDLVNKLTNYAVVFAIGGVQRTTTVVKQPHEGINVLYVGTASHTKLHNSFIRVCTEISRRLTNVRFICCTNDCSAHLQEQAKAAGIENLFEFHRSVEDIAHYHSMSDIFAYPLQPDHYGTAEQSLQEAMGSALPIVVLDNPAETHLVTHEVTGLISSSIDHFAEDVIKLATNPNLAHRLGNNARHHALSHFCPSNTVAELEAIYKRLLNLPKRGYKLNLTEFHPTTIGSHLFFLHLGDEAMQPMRLLTSTSEAERKQLVDVCKSRPYMLSSNKGGLYAYLKYFPEDPSLLGLAKHFS